MGILNSRGSGVKRHTSRRRKAQAQKPRSWKLTVPVVWSRSAGRGTPAPGTGRETRTRSHAVSWRSRLRGAFTALFASSRWVSLLLLLVIGAAFYLVGADSGYYISSVDVEGTATLSRQAVIEASGLDGVHIFWIGPAEAARRVAAIPSVLTTTVEIFWPNRVSITVSEREPVMVWDQAGDRFWVDKEGMLMQARQQSTGMLVILSQESEKLYVGERIPPEVLFGALQLRQERPNIDSLFFERGNGLSYEDGRNWRAFFGTGLDMNQKLAVYETLVEDLQARDLQPKYISVINKDKPFYLLAEPAE